MKIIELYSKDGLSYFREIESEGQHVQEIGVYSDPYQVKTLQFRDFTAGRVFDFHPAPQAQYIIYLEGSVEVEASAGETRLLQAGDILFANDTKGRGHVSRTVSPGRAVIVVAGVSG